MRVGKVVKSNHHCDYVVEIDDRLTVKDPPAPEAYGFGTFIKLETKQRHWGVGVVYNTQLFNPAFLNSGPRLSTDPSPIYSPDLQSEIKTLVSVFLVGTLEPPERLTAPDLDHHVFGYQGIPKWVVPVNTFAYKMSEEDVYHFHQDSTGNPQFTYYGLLQQSAGSFSHHLIYQVLNEISPMFKGAHRRALEILSKELAWKMTMGAMR